MLVATVLLMIWKYVRSNKKWRINVSHDCAGYEWNYALPASQHCRLSPKMITSSGLDHSVYLFPHPELCLLSLQMEESHP